jgi:hypothetical protein
VCVLKYDHGAIVAWLGLVHVRSSTVYEDEGAWGKVKVAYGVGMPPLKLSGRGKVACEDTFSNGGEVVRSFLELAGMNGYEVGSG